MKLSVIVPVYNMASGGKLTFCLDSLVNQTLDKSLYEIIAVDDASTDNSYEILKSYDEKYENFHAFLSKENHHQGGAKNIGLKAAKGKWIGFIDADDFVEKEYYERLLKKADESDADMVGCDYQMTSKHSFQKTKRVPNNSKEQTGVLDFEKYKKLLLDPGSLVVKIYKREIVLGSEKYKEKVFPEDIFYEDNAVAMRWMLRAKHFEYIEDAMYFYYQHTDSTVHTISQKNLEDRKIAGKLLLEDAKKYGYFEKYKDEIEFKFTVLFYINTLFSAMPKKSGIKNAYRFTEDLARQMKENFPNFEENIYYKERINKEEKKLIHMQMKSQISFYIYYRLLWLYRDVRAKI